MHSVIKAWQPPIQSEITTIIQDFSQTHSRYELDSIQLAYLHELSLKGKQFRGCLLAGFYSLLQPDLSDAEKKTVARLAAAVELHGTAILIHDDIIDKSEKRRGMASIHSFVTTLAKKRNLLDPEDFGKGAAICLADVLFFLADKTVAELELPAEMRVKIAAINAEELALLGLAEIEDMRLSSSSQPFSKEEILQMFAGKTGRYTGRWPLQLAAVLAELSEPLSKSIADVGEKIGVLYQLRDDELGVFGDEAATGKSSTSDLTEGKKTFYYWYLQQLPAAVRDEVFAVLGKVDASATQLQWLKVLIEEQGIRQKVAEDIGLIKDGVSTAIQELEVAESPRQFLQDVLQFVTVREK